MESSQSPPERTCPNCSAPAESKQRWCLECGAELPQSRRHGLRSAVGIATTLTVLVGAASAGGYTLLQDGKEPPPPAQTIAQTPPPPVTPPPDTSVPPPGDTPTVPSAPPLPDAGTGGGTNGTSGGGTGGTGGTSTPPVDTSVPDLSDDLDTSTPPPPPPSSDDTQPDDDGSVRPERQREQDREQRAPPRPRLVETNVAFGSSAAAYAPYATDDIDLGDTSKLVDGTTRSVWKSPPVTEPGVQPQIGVFVELASRERVRRLIVETPTPGMSVEIYASRNASPPASITDPGWVHLTDRANIPARATIPLPGDGRFRYFLVWIRSLAPDTDRAEISEIELIGLAPE